MSKTYETLTQQRPWIRYIDDERGDGGSIIVTLAKGWDFEDEPGCGVRGFDTIKELKQGTAKHCVDMRVMQLRYY